MKLTYRMKHLNPLKKRLPLQRRVEMGRLTPGTRLKNSKK